MTKFTKEQQRAIDLEGSNILVSAGAGSGKTAVLTERVLRKVKAGTPINRLLILTFTKAAAGEMKERIRKKLREEKLQEALALLDNSYITTFDSFALSVVKKYHVELGLSKDVAITEEAILALEKDRILDQILEEEYTKEQDDFLALLSSFALKDDQMLKKYILGLLNSFDLLLHKEEIYDTYEEHYYNDAYLDALEEAYLTYLKKKQVQGKEMFQELLANTEGTFQEKLSIVLAPFLQAETYQEMKTHLDFRLPNLPKNSEDEIKELKQKLSKVIKQIRDLCTYEDQEEMKNELLSTRQNTLTLLRLTRELDERFTQYKQAENLFNFMDIARYAIQAVSQFPSIQEELKASFDEIMVDEYQDTNDLQEAFLSYIAKENVYMVGDIKQSIYRFRNANPLIFKEKYQRYKKEEGGVAIDLSKNFRSRQEVLEDINLLFSKLMNEIFGGVTYQDGHEMIFGNTLYLEQKQDTDYFLEVDTYQMEENDSYQDFEKEIFIIANDIQQKIKEKYLVFDKDEHSLRPVTYSDFAILLDRSKYFDTYKKIFEYLGIPLRVFKEEKITSEMDLGLLKNMYVLLENMKNQTFSVSFRHAYVALARSFLYEMSDTEIYQSFLLNTFFESPLFQDFKSLVALYDTMPPSILLSQLLEITHYEEKLIRKGKIASYRKRMEYLSHLATSLEKIGKTNDDFLKLLEGIFENGLEIGLSYEEEGENAVSLMSIHKSKGLEFPICYFADFNHLYNLQELKEKIKFHLDYGILLPSVTQEEEVKTIREVLLKEKIEEEEISEKIRLFYVALTRAREKMIIVCPKVEESKKRRKELQNQDRKEAMSFAQMFSLLYPEWEAREKEIQEIPHLSKEYLKPQRLKTIEREEEEPYSFVEEKPIEAISKAHFSKTVLTTLSKEEQENIALGLQIHEILERIDFENPQYETLPIPTDLKQSIKAFLESDFIKENRHAKIYREYEFLEEIEHTMYHGIIDVLFVKEQEAIILDYKLKNIVDEAYKKQLFGYQKVIEKRTGLPTKTYLYSILEQKLQQIFDK